LGDAQIPAGTLYGAQTLRAFNNFALNYRRTNIRLIYAIVKVKKAAALTWFSILKEEKFRLIADACDRILRAAPEEALVRDAFITDALQGGAGTSTNMNVNEVLANLALTAGGGAAGDYGKIHPLDDVNRGQSTNDVYPSALRIAAIECLRSLSDGCAALQEALQRKENEFAGVKKLGRTELMDAVPVTLGGEFGAFAQAIGRDRWRLYKIEERLRQINIGGAAVGIADRENRRYRPLLIEKLREITGIGLALAEYPQDITQNNDVFVEVSGLLKALAVNLMKIAGDLRLMNSGPAGGFGEIVLEPMQAGSTIMPGKVNPVIPEMTIQAAIRVCSNDSAITMAASRGEFELNAFTPLIADSLLESLSLLEHTVRIFRTACIERLSANLPRCAANLEASLAFAASFTGKLGYDTVARIIRENSGDPVKTKAALSRRESLPE